MGETNFNASLLDDPRQIQRDACGVGFVAQLKGQQSHKVVSDGLQILQRMDHRGGRSADPLQSDGAGILLQVPHAILSEHASRKELSLPPQGHYSVGMFFLPTGVSERTYWAERISEAAKLTGLELLFLRDVPIEKSALGIQAAESCPHIEQAIFLNVADSLPEYSLEAKNFLLRKRLEHTARERYGLKQLQFYVASLSCENICYKALATSDRLGAFYPDLLNPKYISAFALVHLRFSTNTQPAWPLAQPFRMICHNGEINTLRGNINAMHARSRMISWPSPEQDPNILLPICTPGLSDSAMLDNTIEFLVRSGRSLPQALTMVIPEPWEKNADLPAALRHYYEYQACLMEPWDGPAFIGFAHGNYVGAILDRNGLRPGRYCITRDGIVVMASEAGVLDIAPSEIISKGRLSPGKMFLLDIAAGRLVPDTEIKQQLAGHMPYGAWLSANRRKLSDLLAKSDNRSIPPARSIDTRHLLAFGYTNEDLQKILVPMAHSGKEPEGSMGNDTPLAVLSRKRPLLYNYFRQLFAQVTNPPIDAIREELVTSLSSSLGGERNLLQETPEHCRVVTLPRPLLLASELNAIEHGAGAELRMTRISTVFKKEHFFLADALETLAQQTSRAVALGARVVVLTDHALDESHVALPALLVVASVHHALIRSGQRKQTSLLLESGEPREVHHFATLLGYGADAIHPYLALETVASTDALNGFDQSLSPEQRQQNFVQAVCNGLLKIMSKMGISTLHSYRGAQIFESLGISQKLIDQHFTWTPNQIEGITLHDIENELLERHTRAFEMSFDTTNTRLPKSGIYQWQQRGELHLHSPEMIAQLQNSTRINSREEFKKFCAELDERTDAPLNLRSLLRFKKVQNSIPVSEVEPVTAIVRRFATGAMSFGSISQEAHEAIAIAMNSVGARSNSGEGGEDPVRHHPQLDGLNRSSKIKQVASARFGVTSSYLVHAQELQIKIAQGAKPGEGGQLPAGKVNEEIARVRHSVPGITLISPPPHHDIYSIEDLAQLIFDLKNANHRARVSVKLVAESGVGTVAAGVAKAKADVILISGHEGGTGSSPLTSIVHAGLPWELGLAEAQRTLVQNNLRSRIVLQVDGQLRTPRDLAIATLLGAEEWGLATGALIVLGCIMMRKCHLNTCPVGIATHDPELRAKFSGQPEHLINYVFLLAEGLREIMADLGFRTIDEMVGRSDCLEKTDHQLAPRHDEISLAALLQDNSNTKRDSLHCTESQQHGIENTLDFRAIIPASRNHWLFEKPITLEFPISNLDRSVGTLVSSEITKHLFPTELPEDTLNLKFTGSAGQSFMAFAVRGVTATLYGEANDYLGKGLSGGKIVVIPPSTLSLPHDENIICGNTALYGATSGEVYLRGSAGERFAVRNSGAHAVVEGIGDHGCEYMTGGTVVVLGQTGRNFAAGMSGGVAFLYDPNHCARHNVNMQLVELSSLQDPNDISELQQSLLSHFELTRSCVAESILNAWDTEKDHFLVVVPKGYRSHLDVIRSKRRNKKVILRPMNNLSSVAAKQGENHGRDPRVSGESARHTPARTSTQTQATFS
jgi:glutamate synthase domain-containing protein 2/glutamate synthase domain-containing protein 1/glutamate synthase domain-containing protein 3